MRDEDIIDAIEKVQMIAKFFNELDEINFKFDFPSNLLLTLLKDLNVEIIIHELLRDCNDFRKNFHKKRYNPFRLFNNRSNDQLERELRNIENKYYFRVSKETFDLVGLRILDACYDLEDTLYYSDFRRYMKYTTLAQKILA